MKRMFLKTFHRKLLKFLSGHGYNVSDNSPPKPDEMRPGRQTTTAQSPVNAPESTVTSLEGDSTKQVGRVEDTAPDAQFCASNLASLLKDYNAANLRGVDPRRHNDARIVIMRDKSGSAWPHIFCVTCDKVASRCSSDNRPAHNFISSHLKTKFHLKSYENRYGISHPVSAVLRQESERLTDILEHVSNIDWASSFRRG